MLSGIDISEKNGIINWQDCQSDSIQFAYLKASEGIDKLDAVFTTNAVAAKKSGVMVGAYHWLHPHYNINQQVDIFIKQTGVLRGWLRPAVFLDKYVTSTTNMEKNLKQFLEGYSKNTGIKPIISTLDTFWKSYFSKSEWACDYPLWIRSSGFAWPRALYPWAGWTFWQHFRTARIAGLNNNDVGLNWFNGDKSELEDLICN
jgi:lysozyme